MQEKTTIESVMGNTAVNLAVAATAATISSNYLILGSLLPVLAQSIPVGRHEKRIQNSLQKMNEELVNLKADLNSISEDQHKFVMECIATAYSTINEEKLMMLCKALAPAVNNPDITSGAADGLGRVIRDISIDEAKFVIHNFQHDAIVVLENNEKGEIANTLIIIRGTTEDLLVSGLISLGLLYSVTTGWGSQRFEWSPLVVKLIRLLKNS